MSLWIQFFLGTPKRFLATLGGIAVLYGLIDPVGLGQAVNALLSQLMLAIAPFVQPLLTLAIVVVGFGFLIRGVWSRPKRKR